MDYANGSLVPWEQVRDYVPAILPARLVNTERWRDVLCELNGPEEFDYLWEPRD